MRPERRDIGQTERNTTKADRTRLLLAVGTATQRLAARKAQRAIIRVRQLDPVQPS
jgi:hypothetical protein